MKRSIVGLSLLVLTLVPNAYAQEGLKRLFHLQIDVRSDPGAREIGISEDILESAVLVGLKRDIPRLEVGKDAIPSIAFYVQVLKDYSVGGRLLGCTTHVSLQVYRPVKILTDDVENIAVDLDIAGVWEKATLLSGPCERMRRQVQDKLDDVLTKFAADYYRAHNSFRLARELILASEHPLGGTGAGPTPGTPVCLCCPQRAVVA